jgi:ribosomal protein S18 acetylase RimI-like enzyme
MSVFIHTVGTGFKPAPTQIKHQGLFSRMIDFYSRDATKDDTPALANVIALALEEHRGKLSPPSSSLGKSPEAVAQELQTARAVVACSDDEIVGRVFYTLREGYVYLAHLAVLPEYRALGIAKALMQSVEGKALEQGCRRVRLSVRLALERTRAFYERLGYAFYSYGTHPGFTEPTYLTLEKRL